ncbi:MAG: exodeoxyribonuclease VII small subunit [Spirochaetales bacterium]|nr:exodeoxyribonuclease VII small subunit [Spirochaetales bacterium]
MSFETDLARLEAITEKFKDENTGLEEAIKLYEEANALEKKLTSTIKDIERKIEIVTSDKDSDNLQTKEFKDSDV